MTNINWLDACITIGFLTIVFGLTGSVFLNRLLDQGAARVCRVQVTSGPAKNIVAEIVKPEPCDIMTMAREAQMAVNAALLVPPTATDYMITIPNDDDNPEYIDRPGQQAPQ